MNIFGDPISHLCEEIDKNIVKLRKLEEKLLQEEDRLEQAVHKLMLRQEDVREQAKRANRLATRIESALYGHPDST